MAHTHKAKAKTKNEITASGGGYGLSQTEVGLFKTAYDELSNYAFLVEGLLEQGEKTQTRP